KSHQLMLHLDGSIDSAPFSKVRFRWSRHTTRETFSKHPHQELQHYPSTVLQFRTNVVTDFVSSLRRYNPTWKSGLDRANPGNSSTAGGSGQKQALLSGTPAIASHPARKPERRWSAGQVARINRQSDEFCESGFQRSATDIAFRWR